MESLEGNQICEWAGNLGLGHGPRFEVQLPPFETHYRGVYADGHRSGREASAATDLLTRLGPWDECLVRITAWGVWPSGEDWPAFYAWRGALGEQRSLETAPGHRFDPGEGPRLVELITLIMGNAWDADVLCARLGRADEIFGRISHDEWYEIRVASPLGPSSAGR